MAPQGQGPCPVCGGDCSRFPTVPHLSTYPFLPGGADPMAGTEYVTAPHRIVDHELGRVMYGTGERVPMADAIKYGLVTGKAAEKAKPEPAKRKGRKASAAKAEKRPAGKRKPAEDRARKPAEDRARKPAEDR